MKTDRLTATAAMLAFLAACSPEGEPAQPQTPSGPPTPAATAVSYACESGKAVTATYAADQTAQLVYQGQTYAMRLTPSSTGARYTGTGMEWWTATSGDRETATLSRLGPNNDVGVAVLERCTRPSASPTTPGTPSQPTPASAPPCVGPVLRGSIEGGDAGAGNRVHVVGLTNIGSAPCSLTGYPTVTLLNAQGNPINTVQQANEPGSYLTAGQAPAAVTLAPQEKAFFNIAWSAIPHEDMGEKTCPSSTRMRVMAPGDTSPVTITNAIQPCGKRIRVNPVRAVMEPEISPPPTSG